jgi:hypothetical protein
MDNIEIVHVETHNEAKPAGDRARSLGDDDIREKDRAIRERFAVDHVSPADESGEKAVGIHKQTTMRASGSDPTAYADIGTVFCKLVSGVIELCYKDSAGSVKQLTSGGKLLVAANEAVLLSGDQSIDGVKTFTSLPVIPITAPTTDGQVVSKSYLDSVQSAFTDHISILTGTVAHGGTIPLPDGYTQEQCKWIVSPYEANWWGNPGGEDSYVGTGVRCWTDANRVVYVASLAYRGSWSTGGTANYMIIGIK